MALQHEVETLDGLSETVAGFYEEVDGRYVVSQAAIDAGVETDKTLEPLKKAKAHEQALRKEAEEKARAEMDALRERLDAYEREKEDKDRAEKMKKGDIDSLLASAEEKHNKALQAKMDELAQKDATIEKLVVQSAARQLASELSVDGNPKALYPHIYPRLSMTTDEAGEPKVVVLGADGKPTVDTLDDLKSEYLNDESLARLIKGSDGSGGGADKSQSRGGSPKPSKKLSEMSVNERIAFIAAEKAAGRR